MADPIYPDNNAAAGNPFGLSPVGYYLAPTFVDIDNDGDKDLFIGNQNGEIRYFQNTGSASSPAFAANVNYPFGLSTIGGFANLTFVDIDNDGDNDAFIGNQNGEIRYFQNTGSASSPAFATNVNNPFGLSDVGSNASPTFGDIDNDGDKDAFIGNKAGNTLYFQNTGTASSPVFAAPVTNAFNLGASLGGIWASPALADVDGDGDLDAYIGRYAANVSPIFYRNTGTASAPAFAAGVANAFGITTMGDYSHSPEFVDIDNNGNLELFVGTYMAGVRYFTNSAPANAAPTIGGITTTTTINDTATATPFSGVTIADTDVGNTVSVTVTLDAQAKGTLGTLGSFTDNGNGSYTLASTAAATAQAAIRQLVFNPTDNRVAVGSTETTTFTIAVNDGSATTTNATTTVTSTSVNDAPTVGGAAAGQAVNDNATVSPFSAFTIADVDPSQTQTVSLTLDNASNGSFTTLSSFTDAGGGVYNFSGTAAAAQTAIRGLVFTPTANQIAAGSTVTTTFTVSVNDGVASAVTDNTTTVVATSINDAPVVANLSSDSVGYSVGGSVVNLDASSNATVTDADNSNLNGGNVTVSITANGQNGEDVLGIATAGGITTGAITVSYSGTQIGSYTGGSSGANLVITLNSDATPTAVQALVRALTYANTDANTVNTTARTVRVTVNDGTGTSSNNDVTVSLLRAPKIDLDGNDSSGATSGGYNASFTEGGGVVAIIDSDATLTDDGANLNQAVITLSNAQTNDILTLTGGARTVNGITATYTSASEITLTGAATKADYLALLQEACFNNTSNDPNTTTRTITFAGRDTDNNTGSAVTASVTVNAVNNEPTLTATASNPTHQPGSGTASMLFTGSSISTVESGQNITGMTVTISNLDASGENLIVDGTTVALTNGASGTTTSNSFGYSVAVATGTATVTLTKTTTAADWQSLVDGLQYSNSGTNPTASASRVATLATITDSGGTANGGDNSGAPAIASTITVALPAITSATYDWTTGQFVLTGTNFVAASGADIVANKLTLTGEGGAYALTDTANVEITSATAATLTLSATDKLAVHGLLNKDNTVSSSGTTYNLAAAEDWMAGSPAASTFADLTGNDITVSNVQTPTVTSATYDSDTGVLVVTGTNLFRKVGATNDIDVQKLTFTGQGVGTYTLDSATADVEITSATSFTMTLSGADKTDVDALLNQIGTTATDNTTYNLAAAEDWLAAADAATNIAVAVSAVTVSIAPKVIAATYDAATGVLVVTGSNMQTKAGATNDITANKLTLTGEGGTTYTLTDTADVELTSATAFTVTLSATDQAAINQIANKSGTASTDATTYNLAAADDWDAQVTVGDTSDANGNGITVSNVAVPAMTSATYDVTTGALVVTGTGFVKLAGGTNDIVANKLTLTGEGGTTYTLTNTANVEITSGTAFTLTLSATDKAALNQIVNKNGTSSTGATTYNLAAAEDWIAGADAAVNVADLAGNGITASNVAVPAITSAAYNANTGTLVVTGTGFLKLSGATNDIVANKLTLAGEGAATYTLTDTANVEITSGTAFTLTLSATDKTAVNALINKAGTSSNDNTTYNLAAAEDWVAGADAAVVVADIVGNGITATLNQAPQITSNGGGGTAGINVAENSTAVTTITATDADAGQTPTFSLTGGTDQARFNINATTGALTFVSAPNFEAPADSDTNNTYVVDVTASDGQGGTDVQTITVTVTDVNETPPPAPTPTPTPTPTPVPPPPVVTNPDGTTTVVTTSPTGEATVTAPATGSTITTTGSSSTTITNPGSTVTLNNTGTGVVTTTGIDGDTTLNVTGTGTQRVDISGMKPGDVLTVNNTGTGTVDLSNLPDGVIVKLLGNGPVVLNDNDGATSSLEDTAPALRSGTVGDGNGDGTPDALQSNVASVPFLKTPTAVSLPGNASDVFVSLIADAKDGKIDTTDTNSASLSNVRQLDAPQNLPGEVKMPLGLIAFSANVGLASPNTGDAGSTGVVSGITESFSLYVDPTLGVNGYWKQNVNKVWVNLASSAFGGEIVTEGGKTRLDFQITDGGQFDADGKVDGVITDPGAAGFVPLSLVGYAPDVPTGGFWF